jgi:hypothetical protein
MAIPVLKNRILQLTNRGFTEQEFGVSSFREFLANLSQVIRVEPHPLPGAVTLKGVESGDVTGEDPAPHKTARIREDLWRAVLDYSSGTHYVWDLSHSIARPSQDGDSDPRLFIPAITRDQLTDWRRSFAQDNELAAGLDRQRLNEWAGQNLPTSALPATLRPRWNQFLKDKVQEHLEAWFTSNAVPGGFPKPEDPPPKFEDVEVLRQFVLSCVRNMSKQELLELRISPSVALRAVRDARA